MNKFICLIAMLSLVSCVSTSPTKEKCQDEVEEIFKSNKFEDGESLDKWAEKCKHNFEVVE